jgi:Acetoacetate decarboxylase (ADC).
MTQIIPSDTALTHLPPWQLRGDAFILNYWISPSFIQQAQMFRLATSPLGRVVQVLLVRYHDSPVGPYDELLILDHPLWSKKRLSSIPKIYVSTDISVIHGQKLWGIPKELAKFEWQQHDNEVVCTIEVEQHKMQIRLKNHVHSVLSILIVIISLQRCCKSDKRGKVSAINFHRSFADGYLN